MCLGDACHVGVNGEEEPLMAPFWKVSCMLHPLTSRAPIPPSKEVLVSIPVLRMKKLGGSEFPRGHVAWKEHSWTGPGHPTVAAMALTTDAAWGV